MLASDIALVAEHVAGAAGAAGVARFQARGA